MTLTELVQSPGYKKFMGYVYGFGAAIAIIGALFKILHLPGASVMLVAGLGVEAIIFALSSFEPPHETPDWSLVYPELAGLEGGHGHAHGVKSSASSAGPDSLKSLVEAGAIDQNTVNQLADGVKKLATTTSSMADLSDATVATKQYLGNVKVAADSLGQFSAAQTSVAEAGSSFAKKMNEEGSKFADSFSKLNNAFSTQAEQSAKLGTSMTAVSEAYASQAQSVSSQAASAKAVAEGLKTIGDQIKASVNDVNEYRNQLASLSKTVGELNGIYGSMLSAIRK